MPTRPRFTPAAARPARLRIGLAVASSAIALLLIGTGLWAIARLHQPMVSRDLLDIEVVFLAGHSLGALLFYTHVDHILAAQRVLGWVDLYWLGGQQWAALTAIPLSCIGFGLLAARAAVRQMTLPAALLVGLCTTAGLLWMANGHNITWAMQAHFFMAPLFALAACSLLFAGPAPSRTRLAATTVLAALAALTSGSGLVAIIALLLLAPFANVPRRRLLAVVLVLLALLAGVLWLRSLTHDFATRDPLRWLDHPLQILQYLRIYLATPAQLALRPYLPPFQSGLYADIALALALLGLAVSGCLALRRGRPGQLLAQGYMLCLVALGSGLASGLMRLDAGVHQAAVARYTTTALLFWIGLMLVTFDHLNRARPRHQTMALGALLLLLCSLAFTGPLYWRQVERHHASMLQASAALLSGSEDAEPLLRLYPNVPHARESYARLRALPGGVWAWRESGWIGQPAATLFASDGADCGLASQWLPERRTEDGNIALAAWTRGGEGAPDYVLALDGSGRIVALTWPSRGTQYAARPTGAPHEGWELWLTPEQRATASLAVVIGERLCLLPLP